ncbi:hypothetical protein FF38_08419 [Lucilia cuprina]|uniref:Uncharacterized protein n=1 Tax=Lucilia cuprina TaxID=7375 RepID=A0A0L0BMK8_LUCCU|nr:hypothetical protein FF38_08419 [Lucilia cuprina]
MFVMNGQTDNRVGQQIKKEKQIEKSDRKHRSVIVVANDHHHHRCDVDDHHCDDADGDNVGSSGFSLVCVSSLVILLFSWLTPLVVCIVVSVRSNVLLMARAEAAKEEEEWAAPWSASAFMLESAVDSPGKVSLTMQSQNNESSSISSYCNINNNYNNGENGENYNTLSGSSEAADAPTENPFARSSVAKRTPPDGIGTGNRKQILTSTVETATVQTPMDQTTVNE